MPDDSSERRAESPIIIAPRLSVARLAALAVWRFGQNGGAETGPAAGKRPEGTRQGHGMDTARSRQGGRVRSIPAVPGQKDACQTGYFVNC